MKRKNHWSLELTVWLAMTLAGTFLGISVSLLAESPLADFPGFVYLPGDAEGVAVDKTGNIFVSVRAQGAGGSSVGQIWKITRDAQISTYAELDTAGIGGLAVDAVGNLYAVCAVDVSNPQPGNGVYFINRKGDIEFVAGSEEILGGNALAFDHTGNLYVTESFSYDGDAPTGQGGVWRISPSGEVELYLRHNLLTGIGYLGSPVGANGIVFYHGDLYVANTDKGLIARVAILPGGSPGNPEVWKEIEPVYNPDWGFPLMPDGLSMDVHGNVYAAIASRYAVVRINAADRSQETVAAIAAPPPLFAMLDTPASLAFGTGEGGRKKLFVANLGWGPGFKGLVTIEAGSPGLPLP